VPEYACELLLESPCELESHVLRFLDLGEQRAKGGSFPRLAYRFLELFVIEAFPNVITGDQKLFCAGVHKVETSISQ